VRLIGRLAPHLGNGCRQSLTVPHCDPIAAAAPVSWSCILTSLSPPSPARPNAGWPASPTAGPARGAWPVAVYAVAARLQNISRGTAWPDAAPTVRVPSTTSGWLLIHASHLHSSASGDIAVIIEPAHPGSVAPLLLSSLGLTPRERDVALLVLRGASTQTIAGQLHLSAYTVKDHLKSIFDKTGVRSRRDLVARILAGQRGTPAGS
jgi:DNA-binding CsgD family transcriptional regulator